MRILQLNWLDEPGIWKTMRGVLPTITDEQAIAEVTADYERDRLRYSSVMPPVQFRVVEVQ